MIRIAGPSFDDLDSQIEACERLVESIVARIMEEVAAELGAVRVAAAPPPEQPPPDPGEPAVSLDTLALIVSLWASEVTAELIPFIKGIWEYAAAKTRSLLTGAVPPERAERVPALESDSIQFLAEAYLADAPNRVSGFSDEMWDVARAQLLEGFMEGESIDSLRDRLRTNVPELTAARARTVARTEVISASNAGSLSMVEIAEFGGTKTWLATEDARTRPTHTLADGQTVPLASAFLVGGFPLHFPGDPSGPLEEIVNCRCTTTYDLTDEPLTADGGAVAVPILTTDVGSEMTITGPTEIKAGETSFLEVRTDSAIGLTASEPAEPLTAAIYVLTIPDVPPAWWFDEPTDVDIRGALTVTDEGRVYGYLAPAGVPHRSFQQQRVYVPMGNVDYSLFMGRETLVAGGGRVVTGALTMDCGHASIGFRDPAAAMDHYDNACSIVASVRIGENQNGVWVAGALMPELSASQVSRMMACQLSGDWRPHRARSGWYEFAGALLVPVPGFPMGRSAASMEIEREEQLVASADTDGELSASSSVPVEFKVTDSECGCSTPTSNLAAEFEVLAASAGLDLATRLETLAASVGLGLSDRMDTLRKAVHQSEV